MNHNESVQAVKGRQFSVFLDDRPGTLGEVTTLLGEGGINIHALTLAEGTGHGYVRLVVDRHEEARERLQAGGYLFFERDVVLLEIPNAPGSLAAIARTWGKHKINIEYAYCAGGPHVERGLVVIRTDDVDAAISSLGAKTPDHTP